MNTNCPFCKIVEGQAPASIVYEDSAILAFMDLNPASPGHTLIIPKEHWENIYEIPEKTLVKMAPIIKRICVAVKKTVGSEGISIFQLNGKAANQVVMHFHVHVIPRFSGDIMSKTPGAIVKHHKFESPERGQLDDIAKKIREQF
ncbi:MAG: HIT family protein [Candidatus Bathyarchaeota archaeon]